MARKLSGDILITRHW